ncbi:MAG: hypothetical protein KC656_27690 [Myxococcales bacterium]|nr:hypothetical protein [Myxococcales bacterium]
MRFMIMHKLNARLETGVPPNPEEIGRIHGMMGEAAQAGIMLGGEGLLPSSRRTHLAYRGGERRLTAGPFSEEKELIGGFALVKVRTHDQAIAWMDRVAEALGDVDVFLGPCTEPWHLGFAPEPPDAPLRFLAMYQLEGEARLTPVQAAALAELFAVMRQEGVLVSSEALATSHHGARIHLEGDRHTVVDGPFAESKELVSGFAIFELPSKEAAIEWGVRWGHCIDVQTVEVRQLA